MKKYQVCGAVFWVALGLFVFLYSYRLGIGSAHSPGPGFFPFWLGILFALLAVVILAKLFLQWAEREVPNEKVSPANFSKVGIVTAILFAYALQVETLGYQVTTFLALILLFRSGGYRSWSKIFGYSFLVVVATHFLFTYLGVHFPPGVLRLLGLI